MANFNFQGTIDLYNTFIRKSNIKSKCHKCNSFVKYRVNLTTYGQYTKSNSRDRSDVDIRRVIISSNESVSRYIQTYVLILNIVELIY